MIKGYFLINGAFKQFRFFKTGEFYGQESKLLTIITEKDGYCEVERFHTESDDDWIKQDSIKYSAHFWTVVSQEYDFLNS